MPRLSALSSSEAGPSSTPRSTKANTDASRSVVPIFLSYSKPVFSGQRTFIEQLKRGLESRGLRPQTLGITYFDRRTPLLAIKEKICHSAGLISIGFRRSQIETGMRWDEKNGKTKGVAVKDVWMTSPWPHIEAGMAYQQDIPILVLREEGVIADGVLEKGILPNYMPSFNTKSSAKSYLAGREWQQIFQQWFIDVQQYSNDRPTPFPLELSPEPFFRPQASCQQTPLGQATATLQRVTISPDAEETSTRQTSSVRTPDMAAVINPTASGDFTEADLNAIIEIIDRALSLTPADWEQMPACNKVFDERGYHAAMVHIAHNVLCAVLKLRLIRGTNTASKQDIQSLLERLYPRLWLDFSFGGMSLRTASLDELFPVPFVLHTTMKQFPRSFGHNTEARKCNYGEA